MEKRHCAWIVLLVLLTSCTANIRMTDINLEAGRDQMVDASGATNTTDTGQLAQADLSSLIDAAKAAISSKTSGVIDQIKDVLGSDAETTTEPAAVSPAGNVEEVE